MSNEIEKLGLTKYIDTDLIILSRLPNNKLNLLCRSNKYMSDLCKKDKLFTYKIINEFNIYGYNFLEFKDLYEFESSREFYINIITTMKDASFIQLINIGRLDLVILGYYIYKPNIHEDHEDAFRLACEDEDDDISIIKFLYEKGLEEEKMGGERIDIHIDEEEPFKNACNDGNVEIIEYLYELGLKDEKMGGYRINIHIDNEDPFTLACYKGYYNVVQVLYDLGLREEKTGGYKIDIHAENERAFTDACTHGHLQIAQFLYEKGLEEEKMGGKRIDIHALNDYAFTQSCEMGYFQITRFLNQIYLEEEKTLGINFIPEGYENCI